jgi:PHP family Zn ribbon phosphoesterase
MHIIADLQLHSKYARAVSKEMTLPNIHVWSRKKGIHLAATGDWTHPLWMKDIQEQLEERGNGMFTLRATYKKEQENETHIDPFFLLAGEVSCIYSQGGKGRRVHVLLWVPSIQSALRINKQLTAQGCNLMSDGRPIIGLSCIQLAELVFSIEPKALVIPAHCWTPWFGLYGSMSGFDSIEEAFGPYSKDIYAVETGLSSNPAMNWHIQELDTRSILSFSDAHSGPKMGREATVFEYTGTPEEMSYEDLYQAITQQQIEQSQVRSAVNTTKIAYTIEFFPEEGKYHYSGHRACGIRWTPEQTAKNGASCPVCGKALTEGVVQRVSHLSKNTHVEEPMNIETYETSIDSTSAPLTFVKHSLVSRPPYVMMVPLMEIIAECIESPVTSQKVVRLYELLIEHFHTEFFVLLQAHIDAIILVAGDRIAQAIQKIRKQQLYIDPGYDGVFGKVRIWKEDEQKPLLDSSKEQLTLFN